MNDTVTEVLKEAYLVAIDNAYRYDRGTGDVPHSLHTRVRRLRQALLAQGVPMRELYSEYDPTRR